MIAIARIGDDTSGRRVCCGRTNVYGACRGWGIYVLVLALLDLLSPVCFGQSVVRERDLIEFDRHILAPESLSNMASKVIDHSFLDIPTHGNKLLVIGEKLHCDRESVKLKLAILDRLVTEYNYNTILVEAPFYWGSHMFNSATGAQRHAPEAVSGSLLLRHLDSLHQALGVRYYGIDLDLHFSPDSLVQEVLDEAQAKEIHADLIQAALEWTNSLKAAYSKGITESDVNTIWNVSMRYEELLHSKDNPSVEYITVLWLMKNTCHSIRWINIRTSSRSKNRLVRNLASIHFRDSIMALNATYLIGSSQENHKFVLLTSNYHAMRSSETLVLPRRFLQDEMVTATQRLIQDEAVVKTDEVYSIALIEGDRILPNGEKEKSNSRSLESAMNDVSSDIAFLGLRNNIRPKNSDALKTSWRFLMHPTIRRKAIKASWLKVYDGIIWIRQLDSCGPPR